MTAGHKITLVLALLLAGGLAFAGYSWLGEHDARLRAELASAGAQKDIDALKAQQQQNADTLRQQLAALEREKSTPATPQQIVLDASHLMPAMPKPLEVQSVPVNAQLPDGPKTQQVVIPAADLPAVRDFSVNCQETADKLEACSEGRRGSEARARAHRAAARRMGESRERWLGVASRGDGRQMAARRRGGRLCRREVASVKAIGELLREAIAIVNGIEMQPIALILALLGCWLVVEHHSDDGKLLIGGALALLQRKS